MPKRHYEILFILRPLSEERLDGIVENYRGMITQHGDIHRFENCGLRQFAYAIKDVRRGYYILMNVECPAEILVKMEKTFRADENVLRFLLIRRSHSISEPSPLLNSQTDQRAIRGASAVRIEGTAEKKQGSETEGRVKQAATKEESEQKGPQEGMEIKESTREEQKEQQDHELAVVKEAKPAEAAEINASVASEKQEEQGEPEKSGKQEGQKNTEAGKNEQEDKE